MARGFGATLGAGSTDAVLNGLTAHTQLNTWGILANRNGSGGGPDLGRMFDKSTNVIQLLNQEGSGAYRFVHQWNSGATAAAWQFPAPATGAFRSVIITYDTGSTTNDPGMYLDGVSQTVTEILAPTGTVTTGAGAYTIGNRSDGVRNWDGLLAVFFKYDRILSQAEITAIGTLGYSPLWFPRGLSSYVPMVRAGHDYVGAATTITGTAVATHPRVIEPPWVHGAINFVSGTPLFGEPPSLNPRSFAGLKTVIPVTLTGPNLAGQDKFFGDLGQPPPPQFARIIKPVDRNRSYEIPPNLALTIGGTPIQPPLPPRHPRLWPRPWPTMMERGSELVLISSDFLPAIQAITWTNPRARRQSVRTTESQGPLPLNPPPTPPVGPTGPAYIPIYRRRRRRDER